MAQCVDAAVESSEGRSSGSQRERNNFTMRVVSPRVRVCVWTCGAGSSGTSSEASSAAEQQLCVCRQ
jgi:hypothetical protein